MSRQFQYTVKEGDTVQDLSTRFYGVPSEYFKIINANPSIKKIDSLKISAGDVLNIPVKEVINETRVDSDTGENEVVIDIDGIIFDKFTTFGLKRSIGVAADTFVFEMIWNPEDKILKQVFKPFKYPIVRIFIGGVLRFTGTLINSNPQIDNDSRTIKVSGYSTCGVLNDCNLPTSAGSPVFTNVTLFDICKELAGAFGIKVFDSSGDNYVFDEVDISRTDKVYAFISKLAKKRGLLITSDVEGNLIIQKASNEPSEFNFVEGGGDIIEISSAFKGQKGFSTFTGVLDAKDDDFGLGDDSATVKDKFISESVVRPFVFEVDEIDEGNIQVAVEAKLRRSWAERIIIPVTIKGWRDPAGNLWRDNKTLNVQYPSVMIYRNTEFLIKTVDLLEDDKKQVTKMNLILPQSYNDEPLEFMPWDE